LRLLPQGFDDACEDYITSVDKAFGDESEARSV